LKDEVDKLVPSVLSLPLDLWAGFFIVDVKLTRGRWQFRRQQFTDAAFHILAYAGLLSCGQYRLIEK